MYQRTIDTRASPSSTSSVSCRSALLRRGAYTGVPGHVSQDPAHRDHHPGDHGCADGKLQSRVSAVTFVELPDEVRLIETRAFTVRCRQTGVLYERGESHLPEFMLAGLPGRLGVRLATTGRYVPLIQLGRRTQEVSRGRG